MSSLSGKIAFVTGGSRGIGAAIAKRLAKDGAAVALTYANAPDKADAVVKEIKAAGGDAIALKAEASDAKAVKAAIDEAAKRFGRIDILVNNAGIAVMAPIDEFKDEDFDRIVAVNIKAVYAGVKAALAHMGEGGRIITIGSVNSDSMPFVGGAVYAMSKAAVAGLTRGLARDLGARGITVNNVQPGPIHTDMNPSDGPFAAMLKPVLAIKRYGHVDEVASLVAFVASPEAGYITGAGLKVDGGFDA